MSPLVKITLVRVGVDQAYGRWNAPYDPATGEFVWVPIPEARPHAKGLGTNYSSVAAAVRSFAKAHGRADLALPAELLDRPTHLDPDFDTLTYGDNGAHRGKGIAASAPGDMLVFYGGLRSLDPREKRLVYALLGLFVVKEVVRAGDIPAVRRGENAHTRRVPIRADDVIVRGEPGLSGRLVRALPFGELRDGAYRVTRELLAEWGGLSCKDGFVQRSAVPPTFLDPQRFLRWWRKQEVDLVAANDLRAKRARNAASPVILVMLRQPRSSEDPRTDPLYEFGSFGLTGCHNGNLLKGDAAQGARLGFVQGGPRQMRLVMLTPPVKVVHHRGGSEATWSPARLPLRFDAAPLLAGADGRSDVPGMIAALRGGARSTLSAQFASNFRSRVKPLEPKLAAAIVEAWERASADRRAWAKRYDDSLVRPLDSPELDRERSWRRLLRANGAPPAATRAKRRC